MTESVSAWDVEEAQISDDSGDRSQFTIIPNMVFEMGLDPDAFALYAFFKRVAGEQGQCWMSFSTIAKRMNMSTFKVHESRQVLEQRRLISCEKHKHGDGGWPVWHVKVTNLWGVNYDAVHDAEARRRADTTGATLQGTFVDDQKRFAAKRNCLPAKRNRFEGAHNQEGEEEKEIPPALPDGSAVSQPKKPRLRLAPKDIPLSERATDAFLRATGASPESVSRPMYRVLQAQVRDLLGLDRDGKQNGHKGYGQDQIVGCAQWLHDAGVQVSFGLVVKLIDEYVADEEPFPPRWLKPTMQRQPKAERERIARDRAATAAARAAGIIS